MTASITVRRIAQTRRELTAAASRLFIERGYEATTVEDIAAAAGISPRTFFRYLTAKEEVIDDLLEESIALFAAALDARPRTEPLLESLRAAGHTSLTRAIDEGTVELFAVVRRTPVLRARWLSRYNTYTDLIASCLRGRLGEADNSVGADLGAGALIGMMTTIVDHFADASSEQLTEILDASFVRFVHGFTSRE